MIFDFRPSTAFGYGKDTFGNTIISLLLTLGRISNKIERGFSWEVDVIFVVRCLQHDMASIFRQRGEISPILECRSVISQQKG